MTDPTSLRQRLLQVVVPYDGADRPLGDLALVTRLDSQTCQVKAFEGAMAVEAEKALVQAGFMTIKDGASLRVWEQSGT
ncbi:hypothetical protein ACIP5Y_00770 [Nocardia sp. NPDC088792]|uniref:hypothetical protein n=1 Tax=Nocardia sp. NPDC088792 TaxID=3364332 RepID=UPI003824C701